jgi:hypothetical protein
MLSLDQSPAKKKKKLKKIKYIKAWSNPPSLKIIKQFIQYKKKKLK